MTEQTPDAILDGRPVLVSASIPDQDRWNGEFDPFEITDAVVAVARAVLANGGRLITAAHPTIAPLLLYVAAEFPSSDQPRVTVYQSEVFTEIWPDAIRRFEADGTGVIVPTPAVQGEPADPELARGSLALMRRRMLEAESPAAAVFIGGMGGIPLERELFHEMRPESPVYAFGRPGGAARGLVEYSPDELRDQLFDGDVYPAIARAIVTDIANR